MTSVLGIDDRHNVAKMNELSRSETIALLDQKLVQARAGEDVTFSAEETRKLYGRLHSAVAGGSEGAVSAKAKLAEIEQLPRGKEKLKRGLLHAWPLPHKLMA